MLSFGAKKAYVRDRRRRADEDVEVVDEAELEAGLAAQVVPDAETNASGGGAGMGGFFRRRRAPAPSTSAHRSSERKEAEAAPTGRRFARHVDTNVVSLNLGSVVEDVSLATGDAVFCTNSACRVVLSAQSTVYDNKGKQVHGPGKSEPAATADDDDDGGGAAAAPTPAAGASAAGAGAPAPTAAAATPSPPDVSGLSDVQMVWVCEFCGTRNVVDADVEELPTVDSVDYILEAAAAAGPAAGAGGTGAPAAEDNSLLVFCVDISGSMCVTAEVAGKVALRGDRTGDMQKLVTRGDGDQTLPGQRRDVSYISRLQCVQAAIAAQLEAVKREHPTRRVALITFASDVTVHGDASTTPTVLAGDRLTQYDHLVTCGTEYALESTAATAADALQKRLFELEEGGQTALGPAMVVAAAMASRARGSRIVLASDGASNVGLGSLEDVDAAGASTAEAFYRRVSEFAVSHGVTIDVVGIEGEGCNLEALSCMPEVTSGELSYVNPLELTKNFSTILSNPVLATGVTATLVLHGSMSIMNEDGVTGAKLVRDIGNVTADTQFTCEYGLANDVAAAGVTPAAGAATATATATVATTTPAAAAGSGGGGGAAAAAAATTTTTPAAPVPPSAEELGRLPFQLQVAFTRLDGMRVMRVVTQAQEVTHDRAEAEEAMSNDVIASHVAQQCAQLARRGSYSKSRVTAQAYNRLLQRNLRTDDDRRGYAAWAADVVELDDALATEEQEERVRGMDASVMSAESRGMMRKMARGKKDRLASRIHGLTKASKKKY